MLYLRRLAMSNQPTSPYAKMNPRDKHTSVSLSNGNLTATFTAAIAMVRATIGKSSGKWYWEYKATVRAGPICGIATSAAFLYNYPGSEANSWGLNGNNGNKYHSNTTAPYSSTFSGGDVIGVLLDMDAKTVSFTINGTSQGVAYTGLTGTIFPCFGAMGTAVAITANFGLTPFAHTAPAGYNVGLF